MIKRHFLPCLLGLALGAMALGAAAQEVYPNKPVRIVVPYAAGGPADLLARQVAEEVGVVLHHARSPAAVGIQQVLQ